MEDWSVGLVEEDVDVEVLEDSVDVVEVEDDVVEDDEEEVEGVTAGATPIVVSASVPPSKVTVFSPVEQLDGFSLLSQSQMSPEQNSIALPPESFWSTPVQKFGQNSDSQLWSVQEPRTRLMPLAELIVFEQTLFARQA